MFDSDQFPAFSLHESILDIIMGYYTLFDGNVLMFSAYDPTSTGMVDQAWLINEKWHWHRAENGFPSYDTHARVRVQHWAERRVHTALFKKYTTPFFTVASTGELLVEWTDPEPPPKEDH